MGRKVRTNPAFTLPLDQQFGKRRAQLLIQLKHARVILSSSDLQPAVQAEVIFTWPERALQLCIRYRCQLQQAFLGEQMLALSRVAFRLEIYDCIDDFALITKVPKNRSRTHARLGADIFCARAVESPFLEHFGGCAQDLGAPELMEFIVSGSGHGLLGVIIIGLYRRIIGKL
ncbi:protein of unknown function [Pseudomonas sp. JV551A1]|uniref:Uncharacterized protein n=1 Tax=Pseudomonas inefficax TaxID=2078786 RepID=A0AAQ1PAG8_9PSED|nr:protein of unknown function [Pseudomonas sp. JV551A1]SPO61696.1 protein of unknown function [Pseudomonas inefficax]